MMTAKNDRAEDADRGALRIDRNRRQGTRREGDDGDDDACLSHRLSLDLEDEFHEKWRRQKRETKDRLEGECL
jgi:hypothetical protein